MLPGFNEYRSISVFQFILFRDVLFRLSFPDQHHAEDYTKEALNMSILDLSGFP